MDSFTEPGSQSLFLTGDYQAIRCSMEYPRSQIPVHLGTSYHVTWQSNMFKTGKRHKNFLWIDKKQSFCLC